MTPQQIADVRRSFDAVAPQADAVARLFYGRLFELDPALRPLFKHDMTEQGRKLMQILGIAVASLDRLEALRPTLQALGQRHAGYGVQTRHYATVAEALLWTLSEGLGDDFTPAMCDAWVEVCATLAEAMQATALA